MTKSREGLNRLLMHYPDANVAKVENQQHPPHGSWTTVDLVGPDGELMPFAIWNETGNVYRNDREGAVEDDPIIEVTPL